MNDKEQPSEQSSDSDQGSNLLIMGLMVVIMILLAGLWAMEWSRRKRAEDELAIYAEQQKQVQQLGQLLTSGVNLQELQDMARSVQFVPPDRSGLEKILWDGEARDVLILDPDQGKAMGLEPDDMVWVKPSMTTSNADNEVSGERQITEESDSFEGNGTP